MKGIILAGGTGTRLYPLTKLINKHLIPVGKHPMVSYGLERLRAAGITEIIMVIGKRSAGLYTDYYSNGNWIGVHITYVIQEEAGGIAQALSLAEPFMKPSEKFIVLLGDNLFLDHLGPYIQQFQQQPAGESRVLLKKVDDPQRYGVPVFDDEQERRIMKIEEKPKYPRCSYCVTGIYLYDSKVFGYIKSTAPSARGELEITDVNNCYARDGKLRYDMLQQWWIDAGTFDALLEATKQLQDVQI